MLVEMRAVDRDDNELPNHLGWVVVPFRHRVTVPGVTRRRSMRQEPRERGPRRAPAARARLRANFEAFVAIETQGQLSQREMRTWRRLSDPADHRCMTLGTGPGPCGLSTGMVTSAGD